MSELSLIVDSVRAITSDLETTRNGAQDYQQKMAQQINTILSLLEGTGQTDFKDCLMAIRGAITSLQRMQETLTLAISLGNTWISNNASGGVGQPTSGFSFSPNYQQDDEELGHGFRR